LFWVTVKVAEHEDLFCLLDLLHHLFQSEDFWNVWFRNNIFWPLPVVIQTIYTWSLISVNNSIGIQHWHNFKNEIISQELSFCIILLKQIPNNSFNNKWANIFSWMNSSWKNNHFSLLYFLLISSEISYSKHDAIISCDGFAKDFFS
jgi:hypothetical protein